jgi:hypothetical protein
MAPLSEYGTLVLFKDNEASDVLCGEFLIYCASNDRPSHLRDKFCMDLLVSRIQSRSAMPTPKQYMTYLDRGFQSVT